MDNWLQKDSVVRVVALVLAFVMWLFVINEQNPPDVRTVTVMPELRNMPTGFVLAEDAKPVSVRLRGRRNDLYAASAPEIDAFIDLSGAEEGEGTYPVELTPLSDKLQVVQVTPHEVTIKLEAIIQKQLPVDLIRRGTPATNYTAGEPVLNPVQILVEGPRSRVANASRAVVRLDTEGVKDNLQVSVPVQVLDSKGAPAAEGLRIKPEVIEVSLPVARLPAKIVPIEPQVTGEPGEGYRVTQVTVEPSTIVISGPAAMLAEVTSVSTLPFDIDGLTASKTVDLRVALPQEVLAEVERVQVTVTIEARSSQRTFDNLDLKIRNLGENLEAEAESKTIKATVNGLYQTINRLTAEDIAAYVSAQDLAVGEHELPVHLVLPDGVKQVGLEPTKVKITVRESTAQTE
ncbi:MAG: YbbR-like domain-containing protein [bacterium]|jgi:YbbR domain-containing protein